MRRSGMTLLELLIAIGLVVALGALVFPAMMGTHRQRAFDSSVQIVQNQLLLARAHAQATGEPVEVTYYSTPPRVEARMFKPELADDVYRFEGDEGSAASFGAESFDIEDDQELEELVIPEGWAYRQLAQGIRITKTLPEVFEDDYGEQFGSFIEPEGDFGDRSELLELDQEPRFIRLAVFLPDGSALLGDPVWVVDEDDRVGRMEVNPWTGLPIFEPNIASAGNVDLEDDEELDDELDEFERDDPEADDGFPSADNIDDDPGDPTADEQDDEL